MGDEFPNRANGNGRRLTAVALTGLVSVLGTILTLWITVGGRYLNREEVRQLIEESSSRDRSAIAGTLMTVVKGAETATADIRSLLHEIEVVKIEQGKMSVKLDEIRTRLR